MEQFADFMIDQGINAIMWAISQHIGISFEDFRDYFHSDETGNARAIVVHGQSHELPRLQHFWKLMNHPIMQKGMSILGKQGIKAMKKHFKDSIKPDKEQKLLPNPHASTPPGSPRAGDKRKSDPVLNLPQSEDMSENKKHLTDEVPVIPIPKRIAKSYPDYFNIRFPFFFSDQLTIQTGVKVPTIVLRLDSIWDPIVTAGVNRTSHQPPGRDTWANIYQFYRVISSDVEMRFTYNYGGFGTDATSLSAISDIPHHCLVGYCITDEVSDVPTDCIKYVESKQTKMVPLHPTTGWNAVKVSTGPPNRSDPSRNYFFNGHTALSFHYAPEKWNMHVTESGVEERWTPIAENPADNRFLAISAVWPRNGDEMEATDYIYVDVDIFITYTVQLREITSAKRFETDTNQ